MTARASFHIPSCEGCRYLFEDIAFDGKPHTYCRARPPQMTIHQHEDRRDYLSNYPLAPKVRCGLYARRWPLFARD